MTTLTPTQIPTGTWNADAAHSRLEFEVDYMTGTFRGSFSPFEATLVADGESGNSLRGSVSVTDVKVQDENLSAHLQSPEFFDAERTPQLVFTSDRIDVDGERVKVAGTVEIREIAQPVELEGTIAPPLVDPYGRERIGIHLEGTVDRTAFGIDWNAPLPSSQPALANDVRISAELYLVKA